MFKKGILVLFVILAFLLACEVSANGIEIPNPLDYESLEEFVDHIITFLFYVSLFLVPLMVLIGAFYFLTAGGDPKRIKTGQNIILYTVIGFGIILFAKGIIALIKQALGIGQ